MEIARADLKPTPTTSRKGTEASRKDAREVQESMSLREVSVLTPALPMYEDGGLRRTAGWPKSFVLHSPSVGEG